MVYMHYPYELGLISNFDGTWTLVLKIVSQDFESRILPDCHWDHWNLECHILLKVTIFQFELLKLGSKIIETLR